jgi:predicted aconitase with swiveling domain
LASAFIHVNWRVRVSALNVLSDLIKQGGLPSNRFNDLATKILTGTHLAKIPLVLDLLEDQEEEVRVSAIRVTGP